MKLFIVGVLLVFAELLYFRIADRFNIIDKPNERSSHNRITLRGGGVIFLFGMWLYAAFYGFQYPWFLAGLTLIAAISFADDVHSVPNRIRIAVHFAAMLLMFYQLGLFSAGQWWYLLSAWIVCTGIINAYNFMDGINGITGGYSLSVLLPLVVVNAREAFIDPQLIWVAVLSVLVFCWFNFRPKARCFAGDVGAVSIAFILLFMLGALILRTGNLWYLVFLVVYGVDSVLTICHRLLLRENIFEAHRKHVYQLMANELKIPHVVVSAIYALLQVVISFGAICLPVNGWVYFGAVIVLLSAVYVLFKMKYYCLHEAYLQTKR
ncbi:glycosyltransferase family 4 protein [Alistipes sp. kh20]|uniref:MraY family glycosyltransferase n=1 Tax=Alistipes montrealensis TaxID=2834113 RepID=UPI001BCB2327|nr:glycosyltransferase family 4 protein [Alistipes montrealensis]MBS4766355.1 glycosyltransferase family 4 protein [Alistipes montrealensis]